MKRLFVSAVCLLFSLNAASTSDNINTSGNDFSLSSCHVKNIEAQAHCGYLSVPENWAEPSGRQISLFVAVVPPSGGQATKTPLYVLAGGPGQAATTLGTNVEVGLEKARRGREVILLDQRGTGKSTPFNCVLSLSADIRGDQFAKDCLAGTDNRPEYYNSAAFMRDLDAVRMALGHEQINLLGGSYGTRAALLYLREYPQHVRSIILDAVAAPETAFFEQFHASAARALSKLFNDCAADTDCGQAFPNLKSQFEQVVAKLASEPVITFSPSRLEVTPDVFLNAFRNALYSPITTAQIPYVIDSAASGNFAPWTAIAGSMNTTYLDLSVGTMLSVLCGEEIEGTSRERIQRLGQGGAFEHVSMDFWFDACSVWPHSKAPQNYREPVISDVPVLLLSGSQDPVTPPSFGQDAATRLSNSSHVIAPFGGHTIGAYGCVPRLVAKFLDELNPEEIDASCLDTLTREPFVLSAAGPKP